MTVFQLLSQPKVLKQIGKRLGISLILCVLVLSPGFILTIADELERAVNEVETELAPEMDAEGLTDKQREVKGTVPFYDERVVTEALQGAKDDTLRAAEELVELAPVVGSAAIETMLDVAAIHPANFDPERIMGVKDDLLNATQGLYELIGKLGDLAGNQFADNIDQDPDVLAAIELLTIIARRSAAPGSQLLDGSDEALQQLLTERRGEVLAGLERIIRLTGKGGYEAARMALGAQEWENAVNGDLSPLTRIANALAGSLQTAGLLHGAGTSLANRLGDAAGDGGRLLDDAARAADK